MADLSDVEAAIREAVQAIRDVSFPGVPVYRGWPDAGRLDAASKAVQAIVTVSERDGFSRNTSRYPALEIPLPLIAATLTVGMTGNTATFAGTCSTDQIAGVQVGTTAWAYRCVANDTPATVAVALAALSGGTATGAALTLTGLVAARTARDGATLKITRQQEVQFAVIVWTPTPDQRDTIASAIDSALSDMNFMNLADGSQARVRGMGSHSSDRTQIADTYRRDLYYSADYSTTIRTVRTPVLFQGATLQGGIRVGALHP